MEFSVMLAEEHKLIDISLLVAVRAGTTKQGFGM
jgi:hypothetical protein